MTTPGPSTTGPSIRAESAILAALLGPDARGDLLAGDLDADVAENGVEDGVPQLVEVADVVPVGHRRVRVDLLVRRDERGPDVGAEIVERARRKAIEQLGLDDVDATVGQIRPGLVPRGLLLETSHARVAVEDHDAVGAGLAHRLDRERRQRARPAVMA